MVLLRPRIINNIICSFWTFTVFKCNVQVIIKQKMYQNLIFFRPCFWPWHNICNLGINDSISMLSLKPVGNITKISFTSIIIFISHFVAHMFSFSLCIWPGLQDFIQYVFHIEWTECSWILEVIALLSWIYNIEIWSLCVQWISIIQLLETIPNFLCLKLMLWFLKSLWTLLHNCKKLITKGVFIILCFVVNNPK